MNTQLKDKWVLVTGASSGFGAATARAFGAEGAKLLLGARRMDRLEQMVEESRKAGAAEAHCRFLDVSRTASVQEFLTWARLKITNGQTPDGKAAPAEPYLDVLVNNAGGALGLDTV